MSILTAAMRELMAAGLAGEELIAAIERIEDASKPVRTARQERNRRYYEKQASEKRLKASEQDVSDDQDATAPSPEQNVPTPLKTQTSPKENPPYGGQKKGCRLPDDWVPSEEERAYAESTGIPKTEIETVAENFRDYWHAKPGKDAVKLDWSATWRRWCRTDAERRRSFPQNRVTQFPKTQGARDVPSPSEYLRAKAEQLRSEAAYCDDPGEGRGHARMLPGPG